MMILYRNTTIPDDLVKMNDDEYKSFIRTINTFAENAAGFDISNYSELHKSKMFSYNDLYNLAMIIDKKIQSTYIQKGIELLEHIENTEKIR